VFAHRNDNPRGWLPTAFQNRKAPVCAPPGIADARTHHGTAARNIWGTRKIL